MNTFKNLAMSNLAMSLFIATLLVGCDALNDLNRKLDYAGCIEVANGTESGLEVHSKTGQEDRWTVVSYGATGVHEVYYERRHDQHGHLNEDVRIDLLVEVVNVNGGETLYSRKRPMILSKYDEHAGCNIVSVSSRRFNGNLRIDF